MVISSQLLICIKIIVSNCLLSIYKLLYSLTNNKNDVPKIPTFRPFANSIRGMIKLPLLEHYTAHQRLYWEISHEKSGLIKRT